LAAGWTGECPEGTGCGCCVAGPVVPRQVLLLLLVLSVVWLLLVAELLHLQL
jgi:hypothetical protein